MNTQILFRSRPAGEPHESNFRRVQHGIPTPLKGEILCRTIWLSLDPYMRPRMNETATYTDPVDFGQVMVGATVGQIVESQVDGFDACINYKTSKDLDAALAKVCPDGIDAYIENVGGPVGEAAMRNLKIGGRVALVGLISQYNERKQHHGLDISPLLWKRATLRGMIVRDHVKRTPDFLREASGWMRDGKLKYRETIVDGLDNAPQALLGLFHGENVGKMLVQVAGDPSRGR